MAPKKKNTKASKPITKVIKGRGDYSEDDRALLKQINRKIPDLSAEGVGGKIGGLFGRPELGKKIASGFASIFGNGDYHISSNSLMASSSGALAQNQVPVFSRNGRRGIRVTEREYIGDVVSGMMGDVGGSNFTLQSFRLNPGDPNTFPWLSTIAKNFEQWEPLGMIFEFKTTSSDFNGTSQALGTVILATEYDPSDDVYRNKIEMENSDYANSTKPSLTAIHGIECDPKERPTQVLYTGDPSASQEKFYDLGVFHVATQGLSSEKQTLGELWVSYDVVFYKKHIQYATYGTAGLVSIRDYVNATTSWIDTPMYNSGFTLSHDKFTLTFPNDNRPKNWFIWVAYNGSNEPQALTKELIFNTDDSTVLFDAAPVIVSNTGTLEPGQFRATTQFVIKQLKAKDVLVFNAGPAGADATLFTVMLNILPAPLLVA